MLGSCFELTHFLFQPSAVLFSFVFSHLSVPQVLIWLFIHLTSLNCCLMCPSWLRKPPRCTTPSLMYCGHLFHVEPCWFNQRETQVHHTRCSFANKPGQQSRTGIWSTTAIQAYTDTFWTDMKQIVSVWIKKTAKENFSLDFPDRKLKKSSKISLYIYINAVFSTVGKIKVFDGKLPTRPST